MIAERRFSARREMSPFLSGVICSIADTQEAVTRPREFIALKEALGILVRSRQLGQASLHRYLQLMYLPRFKNKVLPVDR